MFREILAAEFVPYGQLTAAQLIALERHYELLERWNKTINLTRISGLDDAIRLHYCESLFLASMLPSGKLKIADVGSGGGFPGIPCSIFRPDCEVSLIEAHQRKAVFLREASRDLSNVKVLAKRAESVPPQYDWMIARAVRPHDVVDFALAPNWAILMGSADAAEFRGTQTLSIPWGEARKLVMFHVEH